MRTHPNEPSQAPWILGLRGSPLEAPENTLVSLRRALELGLDGFACDVRACRGGDLVLLRDETLARTTDGEGPLAGHGLPELSRLDAGGWFGARFRGEPLPLLEEALELGGEGPGRQPLRLLLPGERGLVREIARAAGGEPARRRAVRVASARLEDCLEAREAGLTPILVLDPGLEGLERAREARLDACAVPRGAWPAEAAAFEGERWSLAADEPDDLLSACRGGLLGLATREPLRALAARALVALAPADRGPHPVVAPVLEVDGRGLSPGAGEWCGTWQDEARARNPFPFPVEVTLGLLPRHGAFEVEGLPARRRLARGAELALRFRLTGGSWRPGGDPCLVALYRWRSAKGRPSGSLLLDAPLRRERSVRVERVARRLPLLCETPGEAPASMTLRRQGGCVLLAIENAGGLEDAHAIVLLDGRVRRGGRGVRARLPEDFDARAGGVGFCCGIEGRWRGRPVLRRWSGGLPDDGTAGSPGRLLPLSRAQGAFRT